MSEHSPGPWKWRDFRDMDGSWRLVSADGDSVLRVYAKEGRFTIGSPEDRALIAAAPDLAKAAAAYKMQYEGAMDMAQKYLDSAAEADAKYRGAIEANEEWHKEVTALRAQLEAVTKQRDEAVGLLRDVHRVFCSMINGGGNVRSYLPVLRRASQGVGMQLQAIDAENKGGTT